jgi:MFS family permease
LTADAPSPVRVALLLGSLVALTVIGSSAVAVALPALATELQLDTAGAAWVLAAFSLSFSVCTALFGRLADSVGIGPPRKEGPALLAAR